MVKNISCSTKIEKTDKDIKLLECKTIDEITDFIIKNNYEIPYEALNRMFGRLYLKTAESQCASQKLAKVFGISVCSGHNCGRSP